MKIRMPIIMMGQHMAMLELRDDIKEKYIRLSLVAQWRG
jgi:hypothetical protein